MRTKGKITQWDDDKGFGFIQPVLKGERVFLHAKALQNRGRRPQVGEVVTYSVAKDQQGRSQAQGVTYAGEKQVVKSAKAGGSWALKVVLLFFCLLAAACWFGKLHYYVLVCYACLSLFTFVVYALDKQRSQKAGQQRTPENTLQLLSLLGGWPGALLAQSWLRHKSKKKPFLRVFWCSVFLNLGLLLYLARVFG
ncbi:DUF1294 domain-containing protein [Arsukibacterium perlucidum]|uniref:DUF1294 domain-containing protein n=1 Tax=Arsukibacterium perlucidum TaxID=368811 RepID=UPI00037B3166|nr:cold shock and DUF1294 domain-containing protein [Arsukibacterium perlucidum]